MEIDSEKLNDFFGNLAFELAKKELDDHNVIREHYGQKDRVHIIDTESIKEYKEIILALWEKHC